MNNQADTNHNILLVEDNPGDVILTQEAFKVAEKNYQFVVAQDGEIALKILFKKDEYAQTERPDLILLDLNIPKIDGTEILQRVKTNSALCTIPVIVLSSSRAPHDIYTAYMRHANSYIVKPVSIDEYIDTVKAIEAFWFKANTPTKQTEL